METKQIIYDYAVSLLGKPYVWGGDDAILGFDCSGLVVELLKACGIVGHRQDFSSQGLYSAHAITWRAAQSPGFGVVCFYGKSTTQITHCAFGLGQYLMIEAGGGTSKTRTAEDAASSNAFIKIRPVNYRSDLIAMLVPPYR